MVAAVACLRPSHRIPSMGIGNELLSHIGPTVLMRVGANGVGCTWVGGWVVVVVVVELRVSTPRMNRVTQTRTRRVRNRGRCARDETLLA
jgi:hypothetical protein